MKKEVYKKYHELLSKRLEIKPLLKIKEDIIRYDFFIALAEIENLNSWDIWLESDIHEESFKNRNNKDSKRKESPQLDLVVESKNLNICIEFGLFRQNSNENGTINKTAKTVKMLNDMIRVGLDSFFTKRKAYFICIADDKILGHQLNSKIIGKFPSDYAITKEVIAKQLEMKTSDFDERFLKVFFERNIELKAKIIFDNPFEGEKIKRETRVIIWEIENLKK